jgi:hypothetical protein
VLVLMNRVTGLVSLPEITRVTFFIFFLDWFFFNLIL